MNTTDYVELRARYEKNFVMEIFSLVSMALIGIAVVGVVVYQAKSPQWFAVLLSVLFTVKFIKGMLNVIRAFRVLFWHQLEREAMNFHLADDDISGVGWKK